MKNLITLFITVVMLCSFSVSPQIEKVIDHAQWQSTQDVTYDGSWRKIDYPGGDVPANIGVCTDVIIRAYRAIDVDLQVLIHEDMIKAHAEYNKRYMTKTIDRNIDHRRTQNIETFLTRQGASLSITKSASDYQPGDIVFWDIAHGHVGIVTDKKVAGTNRYHVVHNIGSGPHEEDFLFSATITGHYRWCPN